MASSNRPKQQFLSDFAEQTSDRLTSSESGERQRTNRSKQNYQQMIQQDEHRSEWWKNGHHKEVVKTQMFVSTTNRQQLQQQQLQQQFLQQQTLKQSQEKDEQLQQQQLRKKNPVTSSNKILSSLSSREREILSDSDSDFQVDRFSRVTNQSTLKNEKVVLKPYDQFHVFDKQHKTTDNSQSKHVQQFEKTSQLENRRTGLKERVEAQVIKQGIQSHHQEVQKGQNQVETIVFSSELNNKRREIRGRDESQTTKQFDSRFREIEEDQNQVEKNVSSTTKRKDTMTKSKFQEATFFSSDRDSDSTFSPNRQRHQELKEADDFDTTPPKARAPKPPTRSCDYGFQTEDLRYIRVCSPEGIEVSCSSDLFGLQGKLVLSMKKPSIPSKDIKLECGIGMLRLELLEKRSRDQESSPSAGKSSKMGTSAGLNCGQGKLIF